jgi:CubicO group peptidase (beta-lactamase class C family)
VEPQLTLEEVIDHDTVGARLAAQVPHWRPGKAHGYHGLTIGTIMDELVRRITGIPIAEFFRKEIGDPRGIDFYLRTPEDVDHRVRMLLPADPTPEQQLLSGPPLPPDSLGGMTFNLAAGGPTRTTEPLPNIRAVRASGQAFGHDGAGGSIGIADPWHGISYAWIPRRMSFPGGADGRGLGLARVVRECAAAG